MKNAGDRVKDDKQTAFRLIPSIGKIKITYPPKTTREAAIAAIGEYMGE